MFIGPQTGCSHLQGLSGRLDELSYLNSPINVYHTYTQESQSFKNVGNRNALNYEYQIFSMQVNGILNIQPAEL